MENQTHTENTNTSLTVPSAVHLHVFVYLFILFSYLIHVLMSDACFMHLTRFHCSSKASCYVSLSLSDIIWHVGDKPKTFPIMQLSSIQFVPNTNTWPSAQAQFSFCFVIVSQIPGRLWARGCEFDVLLINKIKKPNLRFLQRTGTT